MVKSLADELTDILNCIENPGLGEHAREEANMGLVCFCRGLVCGLRGGLQVTGDTPISVDEALADALKPDWERAEAKRRADEARCREERRRKDVADRRRCQENAQRNEPKWDPEAAQRSLDSMGKVDVGFRGGLRPAEEDMCIRPSIGEALKDPGCIPDCH